MFEAVVMLCLNLAEGPCRTHLIPGYEAETAQGCARFLAQSPPDLARFAPLSAKSEPLCQPVGQTLDVVEVAPGVFVHVGAVEEPDRTNLGDVSTLGFVVGAEAVALIDTGSAAWMGEAIWRTIRAQTDLPISHVVITHMHPDHALGGSVLADAGAQIVGHAGLDRALADRRENYLESLNRLIGPGAFLGTKVAPVDIAVIDSLLIDLGGRTLDLRAWPLAHTGTDVTVFDPETGTLFAGDLVFHRHIPALDGKLTGWRAVLSEMQGLAVSRVVPGHGGPVLDWPAGGADMQRYLGTLETDTRAAIDAGLRLGAAVEVIATSEVDQWELFEAFNARNATVAFTELEWD
ncbi:MAG: quinoprotein relay system zinc metallohydrolase 2 [Sedimentitalea sp.]